MSTAVGERGAKLRSLVEERIELWRAGEPPDAAAFVAEHPELSQIESLVLDLVQEEYCLRVQAGDALDRGRLLESLPAHRESLEQLFEVEEFLDQCPQFALAKQHVAWPVPGREFLGYEVVQELGSGTFAGVFLAREPELGSRLVVIKVSRYGMFEAGTLGKLSHPNIMPVHSVQYDQATGWTAICMPLLGTATAVDLLEAAFANGRPRAGAIIAEVAARRRPIAGYSPEVSSEETRHWQGTYADGIARLGWRLAEGLAAAHAAGVRHHDIKPSNVLLSWSGRPLLLDFNLAVDDLAVVNRPGGTREYLAPELAAHWRDRTRRAALRNDPRCDIYSLGAVLHQLLFNRLPGANEAGRVDDSGVDARLSAIVRKCLAADADARYATAEELAAALAAYLSPAARARRYVKRHRRAFLAAGVAAAVFASGSAAYVASLPPYPERLLERGFAAFERGDYLAALEIFDRCVELQRESPEVRFARGQTLLRLQRWNDARADFESLRRFHTGWSYALAGYCFSGAGDLNSADAMYHVAYRDGGLRNLTFLLHYADARIRSRLYDVSIGVYSEVLKVQPECTLALRGRARAAYLAAYDRRQIRVMPNLQAFDDARADVRLNPGQMLPLLLAAQIFGYAVQINPRLDEYRQEGSEYLKQALLCGMTRESFLGASMRFEPLMTDELWPLLARAPLQGPGFFFNHYERPPFSGEARWTAFLEEADQRVP